MPNTQASITAALGAQRAFWSDGSSRSVEFRLRALRRLREVFLRHEEIGLLRQVLRLLN